MRLQLLLQDQKLEEENLQLRHLVELEECRTKLIPKPPVLVEIKKSLNIWLYKSIVYV